MKKLIRPIAALGLLLSFSCSEEPIAVEETEASDLEAVEARVRAKNRGAVYVLNNDEDTNRIMAYARDKEGFLEFVRAYSTRGQGTGSMNVAPGPGAGQVDPLASNYAIIMDQGNEFVFAVNAGSHSIASFRSRKDATLDFRSRVRTSFTYPVSLASTRNILYVACVNEGNPYLEGFRFGGDGKLQRIEGSARALEGRPTSIRFSKDGKYLISTGINTNTLQVWPLEGRRLGEPYTYHYPEPADGRVPPNPFGIETIERDANRDQVVIVAEARGGTDANNSSLSTFRITKRGGLTPLSLDVQAGDAANGAFASCWLATLRNDTRVYTSNTGSGTISAFHLDNNKRATLGNSNAYNFGLTPPMGGITDMVSIGRDLYQLDAITGDVIGLVNTNGALYEFGRFDDGGFEETSPGGHQGITGW